MKFFLTILIMALVAQVSLAASIQRFKREDKPTAMSTFKDLTVIMIDRLEIIEKELPDTDGYKQYRNEIKEIVKMYETKTKEDEWCIEKLVKIVFAIGEFIESLEKEDNEESKKVLALIAKYKSEKLENHFGAILKEAKEFDDAEMMKGC